MRPTSKVRAILPDPPIRKVTPHPVHGKEIDFTFRKVKPKRLESFPIPYVSRRNRTKSTRQYNEQEEAGGLAEAEVAHRSTGPAKTSVIRGPGQEMFTKYVVQEAQARLYTRSFSEKGLVDRTRGSWQYVGDNRFRPVVSGRLISRTASAFPDRNIAPTSRDPLRSSKPGDIELEEFNLYGDTIPPTISDIDKAHDFFASKRKTKPEFLLSVSKFRDLPMSTLPEVAFVGRSNVGKSSLINAILNAEDLARTSKMPGFTKTMNLYGIGGRNKQNGAVRYVRKQGTHSHLVGGNDGGFVLTDLPGYGHGSQQEWGVEIMKYIRSRKQLRRVFVLLDAEHGIKDKDRSLLASLRLAFFVRCRRC